MEKINAEVISVKPDKVKISVERLEDFKIAEEDLKVGSYLQISDDNDVILIAIIESFSIDLLEVKKSDDKGSNYIELQRKYIIEASPVGILKDSRFIRGGDTLSIPPKAVKPAETKYIKQIFENSIESDKKFSFSKLANNPEVSVPVDGNKFFNKHLAIVGASGSGKSHTTAKIIQNATSIKESEYEGLNNSHVIIFDIHSEYESAFPNANRINVDNLVLPYWLLNGEELEEIFLESGEFNNYNQASILRKLIVSNKKKNNTHAGDVYFDSPIKFNIQEVLTCLKNLKNETKNAKTTNRVMIVDDSYELNDGKTEVNSGILLNDEEKILKFFEGIYDFHPTKNQNIKQGDYADGTLDKFISRFENKIKDKRLRFLFGDASQEISFIDVIKNFIGYKGEKKSNVTIIDLSGVPFEVLSITVSLISRLLFEFGYYTKKKQGENNTPLLLVYEEAHKYAPKSNLVKYRSSTLAIERIAKEGRKYGVTLAIVSQRPSEISETIFSQCNNFMAMRLTNPDDQNYVKRLLPDTLDGVTESLPSLKSGEALLIGDAVVMPSIVSIDRCANEPSSNDIRYIELWKEKWRDIDFNNILESWLD
ncbi:anti-phage-associated helicase HerA [Bacillus halotolerans]|uniref:anti-phage-associated helicase HerA n=1 Tax=Bacillus halotolerans TaxID=260554 RepID=UPI00192CD657|nr:anti-phage-associated helicase HerA [Bacillus halotolerans]MBL4964001.1 ATP-binding protein [Bacillus halotolerans]